MTDQKIKKHFSSSHFNRQGGVLCSFGSSSWPFQQEIWKDLNELSQQKEEDDSIFLESSGRISCISTDDYKIDQPQFCKGLKNSLGIKCPCLLCFNNCAIG